MEPSKKAPEITALLDKLFGRTEHITNDTCAICHGEAKSFDDELSRKDYTITGMCQTCQNGFYEESDD